MDELPLCFRFKVEPILWALVSGSRSNRIAVWETRPPLLGRDGGGGARTSRFLDVVASTFLPASTHHFEFRSLIAC